MSITAFTFFAYPFLLLFKNDSLGIYYHLGNHKGNSLRLALTGVPGAVSFAEQLKKSDNLK